MFKSVVSASSVASPVASRSLPALALAHSSRRRRCLPPAGRALAVASCALAVTAAYAQQIPTDSAGEVVVTANRTEQRRFDAAASIDAVAVDSFRTASALVNMSELLSAVPGLQVRERQNYAQDLQISVRGFGTRSTFGVRGVRILIDGIPATNPDGQGQAATASLTSAKRIEVLRGPVAQLYGNAAGGVVQVFTNDPPRAPAPSFGTLSLGAGTYRQRAEDLTIGVAGDTVSSLFDLSQFSTDGYRDHSAARRTQFNAKIVARPSADTTITGIFNVFDQPLAQDPLGLTHDQFLANPRQVAPVALSFNTRKTIKQDQAGVVVEQRLTADDTVNARLYGGNRKVFQTLSLSGVALNSSGGVVDLQSDYGGVGTSWSHRGSLYGQTVNTTVGLEADNLRQQRRGFVNNAGTPGALRRNEIDRARNLDLFGQAEWLFAPQWSATAGLRQSRVRLAVDDHFVTAASPNDSGAVEYHNTSPVAGLVWHASDSMNVYANLGRGFETPTLAETAYRLGATGPNLGLQPSRSTQGEIGMKLRRGIHNLDLALFASRSSDEIVPLTVDNGRSIFQNVNGVTRRGAEASWSANWERVSTQLSYTLLDARFRERYLNAANLPIAAGNHLPGAPLHSLFAQVRVKPIAPLTMTLEMRAESHAWVDDVNSDTAPGYAVINASSGYEFGAGPTRMYLFARLDNLTDRNYAGSVIVNDGNRRFFEPAAGRRAFVGLRTMF